MTFTIADIGNSGAAGISNSGVVAGTARVGTQLLGYDYQNGTLTYLSASSFSVGSISPNGQWIAGYSYLNPYGNAAYWHNGAITSVGSLSQAPSDVAGINDKGDIAGSLTLSDHNQVAFYQANGGAIVTLGSLNNAAAWNGAYSTASAINDAGQVAGTSVYGATSTQHAFLWQNGTMTDLGSLVTGGASSATGIDQAGDVVGWSSVSGGGLAAVLWSKGSITTLATVPGLQNSIADGINDDGQIVGSASTAGGQQHAVLWENGTAIDLNSLLPSNSGWVLTGAWSINDSGQVVGVGTHNGVQTSFLIDLSATAAVLPAVQAFEAGTLASPTAVQAASSDVVNNLDGLEAMAKAGKLLSVALTDTGTPVLTITQAQSAADHDALALISGSFDLAIKASDTGGAIAGLQSHPSAAIFDLPSGDYRVTSTTGGFTVTSLQTGSTAAYTLTGIGALQFSDGTEILAEPAAGKATLTDLGSLNGTNGFNPLGIDKAGDVVGTNAFNGNFANGVGGFWSNGTMASIGVLPNQTASSGNGISSDGWIAGESHVAAGTFSSANPAGPPEAVLWEPGAQPTLVALGYLQGDTRSIATAVNSQHQAVGLSYSTSSLLHGFLWQNGAMTEIGSATVSTSPLAINDVGEVVGYVGQIGGSYTAFSWLNGTMTSLAGLTASANTTASAINASGRIIGTSTLAGGQTHAVSWQNGAITDLGALGGNNSVAEGINSQGWIVGNSGGKAVIWAGGTLIDLNSLLPADSGWTLTDADAINDAGQIAGTGMHNGAAAAFELTLPTLLPLSAATAAANETAGLVYGAVTVTDTAAGVAGSLDALQALAAAGNLKTVDLSDTGFASLSVSATQLTADKAALNDINGNFTLSIAAPASGGSVNGMTGHGNILVVSGNAAQYSVTPTGNGTGFQLAGPGGTDTLGNIQAIQFGDHTAIVAATPNASAPTTGNITELYGAAFGRLPDTAGLAYYQAELAAAPGTPLTTFATDFLSSPEYTGNSAHAYAQTTVGDTQFVSDLYQNLLNRAPQAGDVPYYLSLIGKFTQNLTAGGSAYTAAELQAHATVLTDFSQSAEFLGDVSVTATHPADAQHWLILI